MQQALKLNIPQSSCNPYLTYLPPVSFLSKYIDPSRRYLPATSVGALPTVAACSWAALLPPQFGVPLYKKSRTKHTVQPVIIHNTVFCELGASPFWRQSLSEHCLHCKCYLQSECCLRCKCSLCRGCLLCCVCSDTWLRVTGFPRVCLFTNFIPLL